MSAPTRGLTDQQSGSGNTGNETEGTVFKIPSPRSVASYHYKPDATFTVSSSEASVLGGSDSTARWWQDKPKEDKPKEKK